MRHPRKDGWIGHSEAPRLITAQGESALPGLVPEAEPRTVRDGAELRHEDDVI